MSFKTVNVGAAANDKSGDPLREAFIKLNDNVPETISELGAKQNKAEKGQPNGYPTLDGSGRVAISQMPPSAAAVHHIFATQAAMFAGGGTISLGENVLVHGDSTASKNGEYVALIDAPSTLPDFLHLGAHVTPHRHTGLDTDVTEPNALGSETLQSYVESPYTSLALPDIPITAGSLRQMQIGRTYELPVEDIAIAPGSSILIPVGKPEILGIQHTGINFINMVIIRTGVQTWIVYGQEYTGTSSQPTREWYLDLGQSWSDHTGIGGNQATSFRSITESLIQEIGDSTKLGAMTLVDKIQDNEAKRQLLSTRVATLEGGTAHQHVDVVQDFHMWVNNQGPHFMILNDRPADSDHIGKDLYDGTVHKVVLRWDESAPYTPAAPFDPAHVEDPSGSGNYINWVTGTKPVPYVVNGTVYKFMVDPTTAAVIPYGTIVHFIDVGSVLTVQWDATKLQMSLLKVEQPTVHVVTTPDHQPLQVGGTVDAKSVPFVSLNATQQAAVKNNSLWMNETQQLMWKDNTGTDHTVNLTP